MAPDSRAVIFTEAADWHSNRLARAIRQRGMEVEILSLAACAFAAGTSAHGLIIPGFEHRLPEAVFVRVIAKGSFEQITVRLGLLHALQALGVRVVNSARAIERCVDKSMTTFLLHQHGLPTPRTWTLEDAAEAQRIVDTAAGETVVKPLFGAQGRGLRRLRPGDPLPAADEVAGIYYLQEFIDGGRSARGGPWRDWRVFVIAGKAIAAMIREARDWVTNIHQGAIGSPAPVDGEAGALAVAAAAAVGADYAGVDLIEDEAGRLLVLEVNSMPAWKGLQQTTRIDIADALAAMLAEQTAAAPGPVFGVP